jgi:antitoxin component YwqK of YwqJK toxin-antitoxin module
MKAHYLIYFLCLPLFSFSQNIQSMSDVESRKEAAMSEVTGKTSAGVYRYYMKGESEPFTGVLYARHDNGNYASWQEYVDGVGQGTWINYYRNGNYKEVGTYRQNRVEGPIKKYYEDGTLKAEGTYKDWRVRVGKWKYYDEKGQLTKIEDYGKKGSLQDVNAYYERGEISYAWYASILKENGFRD